MIVAVYDWQSTPQRTKSRLMARSGAEVHAAGEVAAAIVEDVRMRGDAALRAYAQKFDKADLDKHGLVASQEEFFAAEAALEDDLKDAIHTCAENVRRFHAAQMERVERRWMVEVSPGVFAGEQVTPIQRVGLYVPGGRAAYPSATYMLAVPAVLSGAQHIAIATPPTPEGGVCPAVLFAARLAGVDRVYKMGGAQAIAALAYGTETVDKVYKIVGPGNPWVTAARRVVAGVVDVGMPAGPTDSLILADSSADPRVTALDMCNEAEHGKDSATLLITHEADFAAAVRAVLPEAIAALPEPQRGTLSHVFSPEGYGGIVVTRALDESLEIANAYAAEHILVNTQDAEAVAQRIENAGEILIGPHTPFSLGNFGVGVNQVLPTGGWARSYSATTVWDFLKRASIARATAQGFAALAGPVARIAAYEGFPAHAAAVRGRL
ncbi:MAG TPA: histidinol dehydrogenase [Rhodospirillaceae bacterium]|jgi:histidinol dehydrogenase|nr:histidinol dehydrogenase [Alphaproteobacteria bacterium]HBH26846.1 histidinol dehydrogenase [Rhodospirillaceae bacterium]